VLWRTKTRAKPWAWRAGKPNDQEAAAAGVDDELVEEDEEDDELDDDVEDAEVEDDDESDEVEDVESDFLVSAPFDFSAPVAPERESLR